MHRTQLAGMPRVGDHKHAGLEAAYHPRAGQQKGKRYEPTPAGNCRRPCRGVADIRRVQRGERPYPPRARDRHTADCLQLADESSESLGRARLDLLLQAIIRSRSDSTRPLPQGGSASSRMRVHHCAGLCVNPRNYHERSANHADRYIWPLLQRARYTQMCPAVRRCIVGRRLELPLASEMNRSRGAWREISR